MLLLCAAHGLLSCLGLVWAVLAVMLAALVMMCDAAEVCCACCCRALRLAHLLGLAGVPMASCTKHHVTMVPAAPPRPQAPPPCCSWGAPVWARPPASGRWPESCRMSCAGERALLLRCPAYTIHHLDILLGSFLDTCLAGCAAALSIACSTITCSLTRHQQAGRLC